MPKSKHRKNHKKKAQARKQRIVGEKNRIKRVQREMYEQIMSEMENGNFDGTFKVPEEDNIEINDNDIELEL